MAEYISAVRHVEEAKWQAVLFVEEVYSPLHWEGQQRELPIEQSYPFGRLGCMVRAPAEREAIIAKRLQEGLAIEGAYGEVQSREAWKQFGTVFRKMGLLLALKADIVYLYWEDVDVDSYLTGQARKGNRWFFSHGFPTELHLCERIHADEFVNHGWPHGRWLMNGAAAFFHSKARSEYQQRLERSLKQERYHEVKRLLKEPRFNPPLLKELLESATLYIYVSDGIEMPETADPWYFVASGVSLQSLVPLIVQELRDVGISVFISRNFSEYYLWQELGELPSDAIEP